MEHAKEKFETPALAHVLTGFALSALVLVGIGGSIYKLITPQGWVVQAFGHSFGLGVGLTGAILGAAAVVWSLPIWMPAQRTRLADVVVYGLAAAGLIFLVRLLAQGSI